MVDYSMHTTEFSELFQALPLQTVTIEPEQIEQAIGASDRVLTESRQWRTYLNALAVSGFQQWLSEQIPELAVNHQQSSVWQPAWANVVEAASNIRVGEFKLCLVTVGEMDSTIQLPRAVMDLPEYAAHFYVAVKILEEQEQVQIWGILRYDQWVQHQQSEPLAATAAWNYAVPLTWFDRNLTHLPLHLRCLEPTAISLPAQHSRLKHLTNLKDAIVDKLSQHPTEPLWQQLTWEQGVVVLTSPPLLEWFYQMQLDQQSSQSAQQPLSFSAPDLSAMHKTANSAVNTAMNVGAWLKDELDDMAERLHWVLLPPLSAMRSFRHSEILFPAIDASTLQEMNLIRKQLARDGVKLPDEARCAYQDLNLAEIPLRLYAVTWSEADEWTLLLILKLQSAHIPDRAIKLSVNDQQAVLVEVLLDSRTGDDSIYTRVIGEKGEQFQVMLALENSMLTLPPFTFDLNE